MSVEVKTPTRTQFEHSEFQCGDITVCHSPRLNSNGIIVDADGGKQTSSSLESRDGINVSSEETPKCQDSQKFRKRRHSNYFKQDITYQSFNSRRKRLKSTPESIVLPTKFLLGGNINDPLNLNSMNDEEVNRMLNAQTPQSSPLPTPVHRQKVEVHIPSNITDPLNLNNCDDDEGLMVKKKKKKHNKHKKKDEDFFTAKIGKDYEKKKEQMEALKIDIDEDSSKANMDDEALCKEAAAAGSSSKLHKIVSPVIPQRPEGKPWKRRRTLSMSDVRPEVNNSCSSACRLSSPSRQDLHDTDKKCKKQNSLKLKKKTGCSQYKFIHGNYNRYYGYRNPEMNEDHRLQSFKLDWFEGKSVLDIGANIGHITLSIARNYRPSKIVGLDIDSNLVAVARKNIRHYLSKEHSKSGEQFPVSNEINHGPISAPPVAKCPTPYFPNNITFLQGNYVLERDELVDLQREEYDTILALSITKWVHLNNGDVGLKRFFRRIFKHLRPGGHLILEPQPWSSYKKRKKLTANIYRNFQSICLKPDQFTEFLLSKDVGFSTCEVIDVPFNKSKGFRRPILLFTKADTALNSPKVDQEAGVQDTSVGGADSMGHVEGNSVTNDTQGDNV